MKLSKHNKGILVKEIRTASEFMSNASNAQQKMFFFSAVFAIANRIMNLEFDSELGFIHHVINAAYNTVNTNLIVASQGQSMITIPDAVFDKLEKSLVDLATYIEEGKPTYPILEQISNVAYCTSGNGFYLILKGMIKLD
jgi:hypothetical protein